MATDAPPIPPLRGTPATATRAGAGSAETRILGQFGIFVGAGYIAYLVITSTYFPAAARVSAAWWSIPSIVIVFAAGITIGIAGIARSVRGINITTTIALLGFLVVIAIWPLAWNGGVIDDSHGLWFVQFNGLPALAAALIWRPPRALLYLVIVVVIAAYDNYLVRTPNVASPLLTEIAFAGGFCLVPVAAALMGVRTARLLDHTRERAYGVARAAASAQAVATERARFNALTHDGVMATLLAAARQGNTPTVTRQANTTVDNLHRLDAEFVVAHDLDARAAAAVIRNGIAEVDQSIPMSVTGTGDVGDTGYAPEVIRTISAAAAEAARNTVRYATPTGRRAQVEFAAGSVTVTVSDTGPGFDTRAVPAHRMGIAVSIHGRMASLHNGTAHIESQPGTGTTVTLGWTTS
ncbi:ATP-binding protein [Williamsia maris]|uniref:Signal transduction histidine kinase n=1 Tax=Williamsia maris TaxID=72806 RepID=A0ABT1HIV1_9NOCA|nr:ATP-binding protein [Williamsia maris]MCP2177854.1 Signal transduction histidine kinase [Williamsia maris]